MSTILDIVADVIEESGRDELEDNKGVVLRYINNYKLDLQRKNRYSFAASNDESIIATANNRRTSLPDDYLSLIAIRRPQLGLTGITQDLLGNRFTIAKEVLLHPWISQENFLDQFPINNSQGQLNVGAFNNFLLQGDSVIWGPAPLETETLYIDYYRLFSNYDLVTNLTDAFITYYHDGLYYRAMEMIFTAWVPDAKKKATWRSERMEAEGSLKKYQVQRDAMMHTTLNLPDL